MLVRPLYGFFSVFLLCYCKVKLPVFKLFDVCGMKVTKPSVLQKDKEMSLILAVLSL